MARTRSRTRKQPDQRRDDDDERGHRPRADGTVQSHQHEHRGQEDEGGATGPRGAHEPEVRAVEDPLARPAEQLELAEHDGAPRRDDAQRGRVQHDLEGLARVECVEPDPEQRDDAGEQDAAGAALVGRGAQAGTRSRT
jgi:hypothetical protein